MEGRLTSHNIYKAIEVMKKGFSMLQGCHWRPSNNTVMVFADYFEKHGNIEDVYLVVMVDAHRD